MPIHALGAYLERRHNAVDIRSLEAEARVVVSASGKSVSAALKPFAHERRARAATPAIPGAPPSARAPLERALLAASRVLDKSSLCQVSSGIPDRHAEFGGSAWRALCQRRAPPGLSLGRGVRGLPRLPARGRRSGLARVPDIRAHGACSATCNDSRGRSATTSRRPGDCSSRACAENAFTPSLRVKRVQSARGVWEMSWAPDGRATFEYGAELHPGEAHVIWRRVGTHRVLDDP